MQYWLDSSTAASETSPDDGVETTTFFCAERGCAEFDQRDAAVHRAVGRADATPTRTRCCTSWRGTAWRRSAARATTSPREPASSSRAERRGAWTTRPASTSSPSSSAIRSPANGATHALVHVEGERGGATAGREFRLLATPEVGCSSVTQFVGYIPVGRAPDHFHKYDEVVYVLDGTGELHIGGESRPLRPGSCVHLPARLVHSLENSGPDQMAVLGVFRPAGSPAEAYYPDGTAAAVPTEES